MSEEVFLFLDDDLRSLLLPDVPLPSFLPLDDPLTADLLLLALLPFLPSALETDLGFLSELLPVFWTAVVVVAFAYFLPCFSILLSIKFNFEN